jgi:hypothetical protein
MAARLDLLKRRVSRSATLAGADVLEFLAIQTQARAERDLFTVVSGWEWLAGVCTARSAGEYMVSLQRKAVVASPVVIVTAADIRVPSPDTDCVLAVRETLTLLGSSAPVVVASLAALVGTGVPVGTPISGGQMRIATFTGSSKLSVADIVGFVRATISSADVVRAFADFLLATGVLSTPAQRPVVLSSEAGVVALLADALQLHCCGSLTASTTQLAKTILSVLSACATAAGSTKEEAEKVAAGIVPGSEIAPAATAAAGEALRNATVPGDSSRWLLTELQAGPVSAVVRRFRTNMLLRALHDAAALDTVDFILSIIDTHPAPEQEVCQRAFVGAL